MIRKQKKSSLSQATKIPVDALRSIRRTRRGAPAPAVRHLGADGYTGTVLERFFSSGLGVIITLTRRRSGSAAALVGTPLLRAEESLSYQPLVFNLQLAFRPDVGRSSGGMAVHPPQSMPLSRRQRAFIRFIPQNTVNTTHARNDRLEAGEVLNLPPGEPHSVHAVEPFKMLLIMIRHE